MNRRQLALVIILNALISLVVALLVVWIVDVRRPDAEELAALAGVATIGSTGGATAAPAVQLPPTATAAAPVAPETTPVPVAGEPSVDAAGQVGEPEYYVVQAGDTLSGIASKLGVTMQDVGATLATLLGGNNVNRFTVQGRSYQVIPQVPRTERSTVDQILKYRVRATDGTMVQGRHVFNLRLRATFQRFIFVELGRSPGW